MTPGVAITLMLLCVLAEAFFSGSEIALVHASRIRLEARAEGGDVGAQRALRLLDDESGMIGTCLIGTNLMTVTGATIAATLLFNLGFEDGWAPAALFIPLTLIFGEALPKTVMQHHADRVVPHIAGPLLVIRQAFVPILWAVRAWSRLLHRLLGMPDNQEVSRQELRRLLDTPGEHEIDDEDRKLILGVLSLSDLTVESCMTPLVRVVAVDENATIGVASDIATRTQHSRLPVYRKRIDHIIGLIHQVDLLHLIDDGERVSSHLRPVRFVPDTQPADTLLADMRENREHFAVVVDEYGGCVGIVTMEDLLEQFVGDIEDERDHQRPPLQPLPDGSWEVPGTTEVEDFCAQTGLQMPEGSWETVAGLTLAAMGRIPEAGDTTEVGNLRITVTQTTDRAIQSLRIGVLPSPPAST